MNRSPMRLVPSRSAGGLLKVLRAVVAASLALVAECLAISLAHALSLAKGTLGNSLRSPATAALVALVPMSAAMTVPRAQGGVVTFNFTASDFIINSGTGSFSYDSSMPGFAISPTFTDYSPFAPPSVFSPVTIDFTSPVGTFSASSMFAHVYVRNDDATWGDRVDILIDTTHSGTTSSNSIIFRNSASAAFGSTALPLEYSTAQFPTQRTLTYWDTAIGGYRYFYINSVAAVPEPSTYAMALAGLACGGFSMWRRRKRA